MTNPSEKKEPLRVTELLLAAYLAERGHKYELQRGGENPDGHPVGVWMFESSPEIRSDADSYRKGRGEVEPRSFYVAVRKYRNELFDFLGITWQPPKKRGSDSVNS